MLWLCLKQGSVRMLICATGPLNTSQRASDYTISSITMLWWQVGMFEKANGLFWIWVLATQPVPFWLKQTHTQLISVFALSKHHHNNEVAVNGDKKQLFNTPLLAEFHRIPGRSVEFTFLSLRDVVSICLTVRVRKWQTLKPWVNSHS